MDSPPDIYPNFRFLRPLTIFGGILGVIQSAIWIGLSITGIVANYCLIDFSKADNSLGYITLLTFYEIYFDGKCKHYAFPNIEFDSVKNIPLLTPKDVHIWMWVYLIMNTLWFISSISLLTHIKKKNLRKTNVLLYIWIFITLEISAMDLALSIIFGLDYNQFLMKSYNFSIDSPNAVINSAKVAAITMSILAIKGFVLWILNVGLLIYFFIETFTINEAVTTKRSLLNRDFISDTHSIIARQPLNAYETRNNQTNINPLRINTESLQRANKLSLAAWHDRYSLRSSSELDKYTQYPPKKREPNLPDPDYTPPMSRALPGSNQHFKNKRF